MIEVPCNSVTWWTRPYIRGASPQQFYFICEQCRKLHSEHEGYMAINSDGNETTDSNDSRWSWETENAEVLLPLHMLPEDIDTPLPPSPDRSADVGTAPPPPPFRAVLPDLAL